jgi:hypothetical protein
MALRKCWRCSLLLGKAAWLQAEERSRQQYAIAQAVVEKNFVLDMLSV